MDSTIAERIAALEKNLAELTDDVATLKQWCEELQNNIDPVIRLMRGLAAHFNLAVGALDEWPPGGLRAQEPVEDLDE